MSQLVDIDDKNVSINYLPKTPSGKKIKSIEVHPALAEYMKFVDLSEYSLGRLNAEQSQENKEPTGNISVLN